MKKRIVYEAVGAYTPSEYISGSGDYYTVNTLSNEQRASLKEMYSNMQIYTDGLVNSGHCMLVISVDNEAETVTVAEQTLYVTKVSTKTFEDLANDGYLPFRFY